MPENVPGGFNLFARFIQPVTWMLALIALYRIDVAEKHFSFCLFQLFGFSDCPGCGIGHAMHYALHLQFNDSFNAHPLGIIALPVVIVHCIKLFINSIKPKKNEPTTNDHDTRIAA
jgi:hypothetical protein